MRVGVVESVLRTKYGGWKGLDKGVSENHASLYWRNMVLVCGRECKDN